MGKKVKIKVVGKYNGHSIKANKSVDVSFKFAYSEMVNTVKLLQLLNENVTIIVKVGDEKPKKIGMFMIKDIRFDSDGESIIKFNSSTDFIEAASLDGLAGDDLLTVLFQAEIEIEDDDEENN